MSSFTRASALFADRYRLILVVCSLLPAVVAMTVTSRVVQSHREATDRAGQLMQRAEGYDRIVIALGALTGISSDAFSTGPEGASEAMREAHARLEQEISAARRDVEGEAPEDRLETLRRLDEVASAGATIGAEGERAFASLAAGDVQSAAASNASILRAYDWARQAIVALRREIRAIQSSRLEAAFRQQKRIERYERLMLALLLLTIGAVGLMGRRSLAGRWAEGVKAQQVGELQLRNAALEQAIDGIATFDRSGRFTWVNGNFARALGYAVDELTGLDIRATLVDSDSDIETATEELRTTGRMERILSVRRKDRQIVHVQVVLVFLAGHEAGFVFLKDVTKQQRADAALRISEERFGMAMLATGDVIIDWDILAKKIWMNEAVHTMLGHAPDTLPSLDLWIEAIHPDDQEPMLARMNAAFAEQTEFWVGEYRVRRANGTYAYVFDRSYIVRDAEGMPARVVTALTDISARRWAELELERVSVQNRMILSATSDGIYGVDAEGRTTFANPAAVEFLGWDLENLEGKRLHDVIHAEGEHDRDLAWTDCSMYQALTRGKSGRGRARFLRKNGPPVQVEFSTEPMFDGADAIVGSVMTFRDVTKRAAVEKMKDEFISMVSHELRTPLTSIRGSLGLIAGKRVGDVPPKMARMLEIAVSNTDRLVRLINDILDLERIDSGKNELSRELCQGGDLVREVIDAMRPFADAHRVGLVDASTGGMLFADRDRLLQTLTNLVGNAIKFSPEGTSVTLAARENGKEIQFSVTDQGRGIPPGKLKTIFERFEQVDASDSRQMGGTGLGLAICQSIVHQHGGSIHAASDGVSGSTFEFTIPRVHRSELPADTVLVRRTLFVCDDDEIVRNIEIELLEQAGYDTLGFASGEELLASPLLASAHGILLDHGLPGMSGTAVARLLAERRETRSIPVVMISGAATGKPEGNIVEWLHKPIGADELIAAIGTAMRAAKPKVLVVEADADLARILEESLGRLGLESHHAPTGRSAIEIARAIEPCLIILDLILPDIDGFGVIDYFKDHGLMTDVPLVIYSTREPSPSERDRLRLGPTEFLTKSRVSPEAFEQHIVRQLECMTAKDKESSPGERRVAKWGVSAKPFAPPDRIAARHA